MDPIRVMALCQGNSQGMSRALTSTFQAKLVVEQENDKLKAEVSKLSSELSSTRTNLDDALGQVRFRDERIRELESVVRDLQQQSATMSGLHGDQSKEVGELRTQVAVLRTKLEELDRVRGELTQARSDAQRHHDGLEQCRRALEQSESNATDQAIKHAEELGRLRQALLQAQTEAAALRTDLQQLQADRESERQTWREERMRREETERTLRTVLDEHVKGRVVYEAAGSRATDDLVRTADPRQTQAVCEALATRVAELEAQLQASTLNATPSRPQTPLHHNTTHVSARAPPTAAHSLHATLDSVASQLYPTRAADPQPSVDNFTAIETATHMLAGELDQARRSVAHAQEALQTVMHTHEALEARLDPHHPPSVPATPGPAALDATRPSTAATTTRRSHGAAPSVRAPTPQGLSQPRVSELSSIPRHAPPSALDLAEDLNAAPVSREPSRYTHAQPSLLDTTTRIPTAPRDRESPYPELHTTHMGAGSTRDGTRALSRSAAPAARPRTASTSRGPPPCTTKATIRNAVVEALQLHERQGGALMEHVERLASARQRYQGCFCRSENTFAAKYPLDERGRPTSTKGRIAYQNAVGRLPRSIQALPCRKCPCGKKQVDAAVYLMDTLSALELEYADAQQRYQDLVARVRRTGFTEDDHATEAQLHEAIRSAVEQVELKGSQLETLKKALNSMA